MKAPLSAVILAGGASRRFGSPKALADWNGRPMIAAVVGALRGQAAETLVVAKDLAPLAFLERDGARLVKDRFADRHAIGGVYSGLLEASSDFAFVCACDMPLLSPQVPSRLWRLRAGRQAVVPVWNGTAQALCALWRRDAAGALGRRVAEGRLRLASAFDDLSVLHVDGSALDATGRSFLDVDTPQDLAAARRAAC